PHTRSRVRVLGRVFFFCWRCRKRTQFFYTGSRFCLPLRSPHFLSSFIPAVLFLIVSQILFPSSSYPFPLPSTNIVFSVNKHKNLEDIGASRGNATTYRPSSSFSVALQSLAYALFLIVP
ncbi:unnamed protein product, partial [Sphacelaria rigidula]